MLTLAPLLAANSLWADATRREDGEDAETQRMQWSWCVHPFARWVHWLLDTR